MFGVGPKEGSVEILLDHVSDAHLQFKVWIRHGGPNSGWTLELPEGIFSPLRDGAPFHLNSDVGEGAGFKH